MIKNPKEFEQLVSEHDRHYPLTLEQKLAILEGLYDEARALGHFSPESVSTDLEAEVRTAKILNVHVSEAHR